MIKTACSTCRHSKVKCDFGADDSPICTRCKRLGIPCAPHVANKRRRSSSSSSADGATSSTLAALTAAAGSANPGAIAGAKAPPPMAPMRHPVGLHSALTEMANTMAGEPALLGAPQGLPGTSSGESSYERGAGELPAAG